MQITLTWHLVLMIIISIVLIIGTFKESESGLDFSSIWLFLILICLWGIYGGIFIW